MERKITLKGFIEHILFALNIFIIFFLFFGDKIVIPYWLQPLGRLHPLLLHFPIVLLLLAMLLEIFRFKKKSDIAFYQKFTSTILLSGIFLASVTVVMGLFLSQEEGYSGETLEWHKWTGVSLVFISSLMYWLRNQAWYNTYLAKVAATLTVVCLLMTGHYGASLTHGDNFVLAPITPAQAKVPVDKAVVYQDVILPILNAKCISCHNMKKAKGELNLADAAAMFKGGKNGKLFVPGNPGISLLLERIHLPLDDEKRMPPKGKPELTEAEMVLLKLWIKGNAEMEKKVIDLPLQDSLRVLATTFLGPNMSLEERYDFSSASAETVHKLNNDYRVITALDKGSPALSVNIYNKNIYKPESVKELNKIKKQIVHLNLSSLPIQDEELKTIATFENLRKLNLNFTSIKGKDLHYLTSLKHLKNLSLSGTSVDFNTAKKLLTIESLEELSLWRTNLQPTEIAALKKLAPGIQIVEGFKDDGKSPMKLNQPRLNTIVSIFKDSLPIKITHAINGVEIRYTTDGTDPDSLQSPRYKDGINIKESSTVKARAYKTGWYGSDILSYDFLQSIYKPDSIAFILPPSEKYKGEGAKTLLDKELGNFDIQSGKWIGYQADLSFILYFNKPTKLQSISFHIMKNIPVHILPPQELEIWGGTDEKNLKLLNVIKNRMPEKGEPNELLKINVPLAAKLYSCIKVTGKNFKKLPDWHAGKGQPAWVFLDEILLN